MSHIHVIAHNLIENGVKKYLEEQGVSTEDMPHKLDYVKGFYSTGDDYSLDLDVIVRRYITYIVVSQKKGELSDLLIEYGYNIARFALEQLDSSFLKDEFEAARSIQNADEGFDIFDQLADLDFSGLGKPSAPEELDDDDESPSRIQQTMNHIQELMDMMRNENIAIEYPIDATHAKEVAESIQSTLPPDAGIDMYINIVTSLAFLHYLEHGEIKTFFDVHKDDLNTLTFGDAKNMVRMVNVAHIMESMVDMMAHTVQVSGNKGDSMSLMWITMYSVLIGAILAKHHERWTMETYQPFAGDIVAKMDELIVTE